MIALCLMFFMLLFVVLTKLLSATSTNTSSHKARVLLGRYLFYDTRLSYNQLKSCASCHDPIFCFTDGYRTSAGADGYNVKRNAPSLINAKFLKNYTWADSSVHRLSEQMRFPFFNESPKELGIKGNEALILNRLKADPLYHKLFSAAFSGQQDPFTINNTIASIASFEETLVSFGSPYDRFLKGDARAMNEQAKKGMSLFFSEKLSCGKCHNSPTLGVSQEPVYCNTGLYNLDKDGSYPKSDQGLYELTGNSKDKGKFRIPSLRNVLLTAPYTHNGSVETIDDMIRIYANGGRVISNGINAGDGRLNIHKSNLVNGFNITGEEKRNLIAFLAALTDSTLLSNNSISNPFK